VISGQPGFPNIALYLPAAAGAAAMGVAVVKNEGTNGKCIAKRSKEWSQGVTEIQARKEKNSRLTRRDSK
jgi:hypothetical protein